MNVENKLPTNSFENSLVNRAALDIITAKLVVTLDDDTTAETADVVFLLR